MTTTDPQTREPSQATSAAPHLLSLEERVALLEQRAVNQQKGAEKQPRDWVLGTVLGFLVTLLVGLVGQYLLLGNLQGTVTAQAQRFDSLDKRFDRQDEKQDAFAKDMTALKVQAAEMNGKLSAVLARLPAPKGAK